MSNGWEKKKLSEVCILQRGFDLPTHSRKVGTYPLVSSNGITDRINQFKIKAPGVVTGRSGSIGNIHFVEEDFWPLNTALYIKDFRGNYPRYIYYLLTLFDLSRFASGAGVPTLNRNHVHDEHVFVTTDYSEQKRIVEILDEAFAAIDKAKANFEKNLQNAKELFESYLQNVFANKGEDWDEAPFGECFRLKSGDSLTSKMMNVDGVYDVYGGNGIAGKHDKYNLEGDNVIIGRVGALCGNARNIKRKIWLTDNAFQVLDYKYGFDNSFLTYLLNFKQLRNLARQAAQPVISNSSLKDLMLEFPKSKEEQQTIVKRFDDLTEQTKKLEVIYQQKLNDLEELKKSILQKAFNGELTNKELVNL
jgi:type I restriction enzyme S subunit